MWDHLSVECYVRQFVADHLREAAHDALVREARAARPGGRPGGRLGAALQALLARLVRSPRRSWPAQGAGLRPPPGVHPSPGRSLACAPPAAPLGAWGDARGASGR
jgi:hypothetical protein